jgi:hypothetical protein
LGHPDSLVIGTDPDPSIIKQNIKKNLHFYCFVTSIYDFLFLEKDVNVSSKNNKQKITVEIFFAGVLKVTDEKRPDPLVRGADPDLYQNVTDPEH